MHVSRLDLNLFVVLDAIYAEGNITRAARSLNLTQPALSHALGRLRAVFDDPLFVRQGSVMMPTPLTRSLIGPVQQALRTLSTSVQQCRDFDPAATRRSFTIGVRDVLESKLLPPLIGALRTAAPLIDLSSVRADRRELESELAAGSLDMAVDVLLTLSGGVRRARLLSDRLVVVARDGHPALDGPPDLETYLAQSHILVSSRRKGMGLEDVELARIGRHRRIALRCQHYYAACRVVADSDLLLTMPEHYAHSANRNLPNRVFPVPFDTPPLDVYLYWHETADHDPANRWLRDLLLTLFAAPASP
ncbi:LysR family transcriptional regulator [Azospirillum thermophilum]|uniref:LysR family transcriptional regulator n=1 Tax=Azospirillum thermophilum TaxID=2202148 RepID=A0A2S2CYC3_9PROT|nr:LysR family transcriptional regulator [Azospirillum thermophilum]AWK89481.1 LysR family transcriptional regulator [Azospirillum thermophilum]